MKEKDKLIKLKTSLLTLSILTTGSLTSCFNYDMSDKDYSTNTYFQTEEDPVDVIEDKVTRDSEKLFEKGKHYISVRVIQKINNYDATYGINNIPDGYDVFQITPIIESNETKTVLGYDIWFVNVQEVLVKATYNADYQEYGYFTFGKVIEKEKTLVK